MLMVNDNRLLLSPSIELPHFRFQFQQEASSVPRKRDYLEIFLHFFEFSAIPSRIHLSGSLFSHQLPPTSTTCCPTLLARFRSTSVYRRAFGQLRLKALFSPSLSPVELSYVRGRRHDVLINIHIVSFHRFPSQLNT